ncbi:MAG: hypothetical protein KDD47_12460, partial [Acidobacteria bacterium]|nr:hypothetical protein [Acidobacteriota bacterium]
RRSDATDIAFTDDLDAALTGLVAVGLPVSNVCGTGSVLSGTDLLSLTGGNLGVGESCTFNVTLQVPSAAVPGAYTNTTSTVTADVGAGSPATDILFVEAVPIFTKAFIDDPVSAGGTVTLEFSITNTSPDASATGIAFQDVLNSVTPSVVSLPASGYCGAGSTVFFTTNPSPTLIFSGANLAAASSCTFSVVLNVDPIAQAGIYTNTTTSLSSTVGGREISTDPASDDLQVVAGPTLTKEFIDDPVAPGDTVTLQFSLTQVEGEEGGVPATDITFSDDLDAALTGLVAVGLPLSDVCGTGSEISGTMTLLLTGGSLASGETCTFSVTLQVPATAPAGAHTNTTSAVVATVLGVTTTSIPASDDLRIAGLTLTKDFIDDPVVPGDTVTLRYTITNDSPISSATDIVFQDNLDTAVDNMTGLGLPLADVCGTGSSLVGTSANRVLTLTGGSLAPLASCTFDVTLQVPAGTASDSYNCTTDIFRGTIDGGLVIFENASAILVVSSDFLDLTKEFTDDPVGPGEAVTLSFTVTNLSTTDPVDSITFTDDLDAVVSGLVSTSGTLSDVCGLGSELSGTGLLSLTGGNLPAGGSCTFDVTLMVP